MKWTPLQNESQLDDIIRLSVTIPQVIFKHSTRCSISSMVKNRLDKKEAPADTSFYYLDLIQYRSISNKIAEIFDVEHESPQVLVIDKGVCTYNESHNGIAMEDIVMATAG